jgi:AcrR family transcriptional regulator
MSTDVIHTPKGGRPRSEQLHQAMLKAALDLVLEIGFRGVSIEGIAAKTGVGKTTLYRRWPNKAAVVMEAFMGLLGPASRFPENERSTERLRLQMHITAKAFRGRVGALVKALMAEAQFDTELAKSFKENWTLPRRKLVYEVLEEAIRQGEVRADIDIEAGIDAFYAPIYYRLHMGTGPISEEYVDQVFQQAMKGQEKPPR